MNIRSLREGVDMLSFLIFYAPQLLVAAGLAVLFIGWGWVNRKNN